MAASAESPCSQRRAVRQQGSRVLTARGVETARGRPGPVRRVVQFRARVSVEYRCNQHHPVGQQGRCVKSARDVEAARVRPSPGVQVRQGL